MHEKALIVLAALSGCAPHNNCQGLGPRAVFEPWTCREIAIRYHSRNKLEWPKLYDYERDLLTN
jgi:hypothetical protein